MPWLHMYSFAALGSPGKAGGTEAADAGAAAARGDAPVEHADT